MLEATIEKRRDLHADSAELRDQLERLRAENARLRSENHDLRAALDAHIARARSTALYGPLELTAGTSAGLRRRRGISHKGGGP